MKPFFVFLLGVLFGFLAKWMFDFFYWRERYYKRAGSVPAAIRVPVETIAAPVLVPTSAARPKRASKPRTTAKTTPDNLKTIKGIGPVIERKLNEVGIHTFEQLATLKAADLRAILGKSTARLADEDDLLKQARRLGRKK